MEYLGNIAQIMLCWIIWPIAAVNLSRLRIDFGRRNADSTNSF